MTLWRTTFFGSGPVHCADDTLLGWLDGELPARRARSVQKHLEHCWTCRARRDQLQGVIDKFVAYRRSVVEPYLPPPSGPRGRFLLKLEEASAKPGPSLFRSLARNLWASRPFVRPTPFLVMAGALAAASALCFFLWLRSSPPIQAGALLSQAAAWDPGGASLRPAGVVFQRIEIRLNGDEIEVAHYRDSTGKRKPKRVAASARERRFQDGMEAFGVDWDEPLSAKRFASWRDHQRIAGETVARTGGHLLTLTTACDGSPVAEESLTVRDGDFHPVRRRVKLRDEQTIEIAELNYDVLAWGAVNQSYFESFPADVSPRLRPARPSVPTLAAVSQDQIDEAELASRLALSRLHQDTSGRVNVERAAQGVRVSGIVESDAEKQAVMAELRKIPHVFPEILTLQEAQSSPTLNEGAPSGPSASVESLSLVAATTPLERYLKERGESPERIADYAQQLIDTAVALDHGARAMSELQSRFGEGRRLTWTGENSLDALIREDRDRILFAIRAQNAVLSSIGEGGSGAESAELSSDPEASNGAGLNAAAVRNFSVVKELVSPDPENQLNAAALLSELRQSMLETRSNAMAPPPTRHSAERSSPAPSPTH